MFFYCFQFPILLNSCWQHPLSLSKVDYSGWHRGQFYGFVVYVYVLEEYTYIYCIIDLCIAKKFKHNKKFCIMLQL